MSDLISRQDALDAISSWMNLDGYFHPKSKKRDIPYHEVENMIRNIPSAEPERTAKVMSIVLTSNPPQHVLICGNCGGSIDKTYWKYCPNCGARLERE